MPDSPSVPLPSLAAVRVFEAVARRLSFTRAAEELGMTQAAVSYQIKGLEERIGTPVFLRLGREIRLTRAGERLAAAATEAMALLRNAVADISTSGEGVLSVTCLHTFAVTWLVPRLGSFQLANPGVAVRLDTSVRVVDLIHEDFDIGLRAGRGEWPGLEARFLFPGVFTPLCTPEMAASLGELAKPSQLLDAPLIGDHSEWEAWLAAAGHHYPQAKLRPALRYEVQQYDVAAALAGQGIAMASPIFFAPEIAAGRLVQPFDIDVAGEVSYWMVWPEARRRSPKIAAFRDWLLKAVADDAAVQKALARMAVPSG
jgi:LysR family glycine cleavage system transcriptional activator